MRSELNEIALIDSYLFHQLDDAGTRAVETSILLNNTFAERVEAQRRAHRLIRLYGQKSRLERIYQQLLNEPAFANQIKNLI